jgi:hypothetical protein
MAEKSHYEILGIEPDSSMEEITLAYKRMAKLNHPDMVSHLDPEFRELAERRMMEINIAFVTLQKDRGNIQSEDTGSHYNRQSDRPQEGQRGQAQDEQQRRKQSVAQENAQNSGMIIKQLIYQYSTKVKNNRIHFHPDIPPKKLSNALKSYADGIQEGEVLILFDNTTFGNAKYGALLTETHIYGRLLFGQPQNYNLTKVNSASCSVDRLFVNGKEFVASSYSEDPKSQFTGVRVLADMLNNLIVKLR